MKLYILAFLAVLSCVSATPRQNTTLLVKKDKDHYVLATVLFYCNEKGDKIVAAGEVPSKVKMIIKNKVNQIYKNAFVKVVSIYQNFSDVPKMDDVYTEIRNKHNNLLITTIPERLSSRVVENKMKLFMEIGNVFGMDRFKKSFVKNKGDFTDKEVESNIISTNNQDEGMLPPFYLKAGVPTAETFLPNTVYYAIQLKYRANDTIINTLLAMLNEPRKEIKK